MSQSLFFWVAQMRDGSEIAEPNGKVFSRDIAPIGHLVKRLWLIGKNARYAVNLDDGDFCVGKMTFGELGLKFAQHPDVEYPIKGHEFIPLKPIYFRRITEQIDPQTLELIERKIVYAIGWQATVVVPKLSKDKARWLPKKVNVKHILYVHPDGSLTFA